MSDPREELAQSSVSSQIWFVRAGIRGADVGSFFAEGFVGIAWGDTGALTGLVDLSHIHEAPMLATRSIAAKLNGQVELRGGQ